LKRYVSGFDYALGSEVLFAPRIDYLCDLLSVLLQISFRGSTITWLDLVREGGVFAKFRVSLQRMVFIVVTYFYINDNQK